MPRITVQYFAGLREQRGLSDEVIATQERTPSALYDQLRAEHGLLLLPSSLRVAINDEFGRMDTLLKDGDVVAFIPPVAGG